MAFPIAAIGGLAATGAQLAGMFDNSKQRALIQQILEQRKMTNLMRQMALASRTDARGNKVVWNGTGFVAQPTAMTKALLGAEDNEALMQLTADAGRHRAGAIRNDRIRNTNVPNAERTNSEFFHAPRTDPKRYTDSLKLAAVNSVNKGFDRTEKDVARHAVRSGNTATSSTALGNLASRRSQDIYSTLAGAIGQGRQQGEAIRTSEDNRSQNRMASAMSLVSGIDPAFNYKPTTAGISMDSLLGKAGQTGINGLNAANQSMAIQQKLAHAVSGFNYGGLASGLSNTGSGIAALLKSLQGGGASSSAGNWSGLSSWL